MKDFSKLYDWLQNNMIKPAFIRDGDTVNTFVRVPYDDDFDYLYYQENYIGQPLSAHADLTYCGLYNKLNGQLYNLRYPLKGRLDKFDTEKQFKDLEKDLIKDVRSFVERIVDDDMNNLPGNSFSDGKYYLWLESFVDNHADSFVKKLFLNNQLDDEIHYECAFSLNKSTDSLILRYLKQPHETVKKIATEYWRNNQDDILLSMRKNEILRQKLSELEADRGNPIHKQRTIMKALKGSGAKTVNVTVKKDDRSCTFRYAADRLSRYSNSDYGSWEMSPQDRKGYEECFGRYSSFHPEDIIKISYRGKTIYEAEMPDLSENAALTDEESADSSEGIAMTM